MASHASACARYLGVFWTTIVAEAEVFFAVFVATAIIVWVNGSLAARLAELAIAVIVPTNARGQSKEAQAGHAPPWPSQ